MLFKCRLCGSLADDGDIKGCLCLGCIDFFGEALQHRLHPINRRGIFTLKNEIRKHRKALGLTQSNLSKMCGCTRQYICKIEKGEQNISLSLALILCDVFGCTLCDLFGHTEKL